MLGLLKSSELWGVIWVTLKMALSSTLISTVLGVALGLVLERAKFPGKKIVVRLNRTLMGAPPVVIGLVTYLFLMRKGPLGSLNLLFTVPAMIIAQVLIITPIICGMIYSYANRNAEKIRGFGTTMGANPVQMYLLLMKEMGNEIYFSIVAGFGRAISEVGAVMIVGGNIQHKTRTMTTSITLLRNKGNYGEAVFLGIVLMLLAFLIQSVSDQLQQREGLDENY